MVAAAGAALVLSACSSAGSPPEATPPATTGEASTVTTAPGSADRGSGTAGSTAYPAPDASATTTAAPGGARGGLSEEQVTEALRGMDAALQSGDVEAYLEHVDPALQEEQRAWFEALQRVPMDVRQLRLDGVVSTTSTEGTVTHVGLRHQITGADPRPLLEQYRWVFDAEDGGPALLTQSTGRNGETYGYPQAWDSGEELAVVEGHSVLILTPETDRAVAEQLLATLDLAAERSLASLVWADGTRDRLEVHLVDAATLEEVAGAPGSPAGFQLLTVAEDEIPWDATRLTGLDAPVGGRILLDRDQTLQEITDYGPSPGGHTALRYIAAYAAMWGDDPGLWPQDWVLEGFPQWWSASEDPPWAEEMLSWAASHHAAVGEPTGLPVAPQDLEDVDAYDAFTMESISLAFYLAQTYGDDALVDLAGELSGLDVRTEEDAIEQAYVDSLRVGQDDVLTGWQAWATELAAGAEPAPPQQGR